MSGDGDEADVSVALTDRFEVGFDNAETGELSLSSRVWLKRDGFVTGDEAEIVLELLRRRKGHGRSANESAKLETREGRRLDSDLDKLLVALGLRDRGEGVDGVESGHGQRDHAGGRVELHRAWKGEDVELRSAIVCSTHLKEDGDVQLPRGIIA
jgi:hypothetical protein